MRPVKLLTRCWRDQHGATAIEYGLIAAMIGMTIVSIMATGGSVESLYEALLAAADAMDGAASGGGGGQ